MKWTCTMIWNTGKIGGERSIYTLKCIVKVNFLLRYKKAIEKLSIADDHAAKVVPERIFSIIMHPMESKLLVFAGDKWGKVGVRDLVCKLLHC